MTVRHLELFILVLIIAITGTGVTILIAGEYGTCTTESPPTDESIRMLRGSNEVLVAPPNYIPKRSGHYSRQDWEAVIDSTWGPGMSPEYNFGIFKHFWDKIDAKFACFQDLEVNWDSIWFSDSTEIFSGVSRGRFAAILNHAAMALQESHTRCYDELVSFTFTEPGVPLMLVDPTGTDYYFGAGLTPQPDSTLLVYKVIEDHPLGLVPGDIVLGYDGVLWNDLYKELLEAQLPMRGMWGSSESAFRHGMLGCAGMNWHLFDTIDIVKYDTGDTIHLATEPLDGYIPSIFLTEQLEIPGVPIPQSWDDVVTYGTVEGTQVGYIYVTAWDETSGVLFKNAIRHFYNNNRNTGLILDFRINAGGSMFQGYDGMSYLYDSTLFTVGFVIRDDPDDHDSMIVSGFPEDFTLSGNPATYYDMPIAVLTGPGCVSAGDQIALILTYHENVRVFGKSTACAFSTAMGSSIEIGFFMMYAKSESYQPWNPGHYLTRDEFPVDEDVWFTPDGVAQGKDDVVEAALDWIMLQDSDGDGLLNSEDNCPAVHNPDQADADADSVGDLCDNCISINNPDQDDLDLDAIGDMCDDDIDGDYVLNDDDNCPLIANESQSDSDDDGIGNSCDNCPSDYNEYQYDEDEDGIGDVCDEDRVYIQCCLDMPVAYLDEPFSYQFWAIGGTPPYIWTKYLGQLPMGTTLTSDGVLSGIPTYQSEYVFRVIAEDQVGDRDTMLISIEVVEAPVLCGDVNRSEGVDIDDVVYLINYIFAGGPAPDPSESGDVDCSGAVDIDDVVYLIAYIFSGGPEPCADCLGEK